MLVPTVILGDELSVRFCDGKVLFGFFECSCELVFSEGLPYEY